MTPGAIVTQILLSTATIGAPIFYAVSLSQSGLALHYHIIFWIVWAAFVGIQTMFLLEDLDL